jgi:choline/glycine/proline betaine transport protein
MSSEQLNLVVRSGNGVFRYTARLKAFRVPTFALAEPPLADEAERRYYALVETSHDDSSTDVTGFTREQLINDFLSRYATSRDMHGGVSV